MQFYCDKQLAERFAVSRHTIWRWLRNGEFPAPVRLGPQAVRWRATDVEAWAAERQPALGPVAASMHETRHD